MKNCSPILYFIYIGIRVEVKYPRGREMWWLAKLRFIFFRVRHVIVTIFILVCHVSYLMDGSLYKDTLDEFLNSDEFICGVDEFLSVFHNLFVKCRISFVFLLLNFLCIFQILIISNIIELLIFLTRLRGPRKFTNNFSAELLWEKWVFIFTSHVWCCDVTIYVLCRFTKSKFY